MNYQSLQLFCALAIGSALFISGCSSDKGTDPGEDGTDPIAIEKIAEGWAAITQKNYSAAGTAFSDALNRIRANEEVDAPYRAEALTGRGWSRAMLREYISARTDYTNAVSVQQIRQPVRRDAQAGLTFVHHALKDYQNAITFGDEVFSGGSLTYQFQYDSRINTQRVRLVIAQSAFNLGNFTKTASQMDLIVPANAPHSTDPEQLLHAMAVFQAGLP